MSCLSCHRKTHFSHLRLEMNRSNGLVLPVCHYPLCRLCSRACSKRCKQEASWLAAPLIWYSLIDRTVFHTLVCRTTLRRKMGAPDVNSALVLGVGQKRPRKICSYCRVSSLQSLICNEAAYRTHGKTSLVCGPALSRWVHPSKAKLGCWGCGYKPGCSGPGTALLGGMRQAFF